MKKIYFLLNLLIFTYFVSAQSNFVIQKQKDKSGRLYQFIKGDPFGLRVYRLQNGFEVFLFPNKKEPRISIFIQVQAGGKMIQKKIAGLLII